tara:strand:+ start:580 stop:918 length:339 start_codon:yes stop_codon:yes gene_type:complete
VGVVELALAPDPGRDHDPESLDRDAAFLEAGEVAVLAERVPKARRRVALAEVAADVADRDEGVGVQVADRARVVDPERALANLSRVARRAQGRAPSETKPRARASKPSIFKP